MTLVSYSESCKIDHFFKMRNPDFSNLWEWSMVQDLLRALVGVDLALIVHHDKILIHQILDLAVTYKSNLHLD